MESLWDLRPRQRPGLGLDQGCVLLRSTAHVLFQPAGSSAHACCRTWLCWQRPAGCFRGAEGSFFVAACCQEAVMPVGLSALCSARNRRRVVHGFEWAVLGRPQPVVGVKASLLLSTC